MISLALASLIGAGLGAGAGIFSTVMNNQAVEDTNSLNEALMRESWAREDTAVQRRVADLKAAGLSPTLAAGSAAASSGPISVKPKNYSGVSDSVDNALSAVAAVKSLEKIDLENKNLKKQGHLLDLNAKYYGMPDWMIAGNQIFGADKFLSILKGFGDKVYDFLFPPDDSSSGNNDYGGAIPLPSWESSFGFKGTSPSGNLPYPTKEQYQKVVDSVGEFGTITKDNTIVFDSVYDARQWFLSIGGTTAEWYYGIRKYGSPENFIEHITSTGEYYFE